MALTSSGCGKKGAPVPPEPRGPVPPRGVSARQLGAEARVSFEAPAPRGSGLTQQLVLAEMLRVAYPPGPVPPSDPDAFRRRGVLVAQTQGEPLQSGARVTLRDPSLVQLAGHGVGWTLRYGVRVRDRKGRPSALVVARDLDPLLPAPAPVSLAARPTSTGLALSWSPPSVEGDLRYNVYRSRPAEVWPEAPLNIEPLADTAYLDTAVQVGERLVYQVRLSLAPGIPYREGEPSESLEVMVEDRIAPAPPAALVGVQEGKAVRLFWNPGRERDVAGYRVYRQIQEQDWVQVGPKLIENPSFLDVEIEPGQQLAYRVTAVDGAEPANESEPSETIRLEVVAEPEVVDP